MPAKGLLRGTRGSASLRYNPPYMRPTWAEISLPALRHNFRTLQQLVGPGVTVCAVVKADAYGHGAVPVARAALAHGAWMLGVGDSSEALELRDAGIDAPLLILGAIVDGEMEQVITHHITPCVHSSKRVGTLAAMAEAMGRHLDVHLKVDTGMGRLGVMPSAALDVAREIRAHPSLRLEGICTHLADSETPGDPFTEGQLDTFKTVVTQVEAETGVIPLKHAANSAAILSHPRACFNMVRPGIAAYGMGFLAKSPGHPPLRPALSLKTQVVFLKDLPEGAPVGYARTHITGRPPRIAILPIGYNDGYSFLFSNRAEVLVRGRRARVTGRVSMDYTTVDVTDVPGVEVGEEAVLIGRQGRETIPVEELARIKGTIPYEITCSLGRRVRRIYLEGGARQPTFWEAAP